MKKIISILATVAMLATSALVAPVASADGVAINVTSEVTTDVTLDGYDVYKVSYSVSGLTEELTYDESQSDPDTDWYVYAPTKGFYNLAVGFDEVDSEYVHANTFEASTKRATKGWNFNTNYMKGSNFYFQNTGFSNTASSPFSLMVGLDVANSDAEANDDVSYGYYEDLGTTYSSNGELEMIETYWYIASGKSYTINYDEARVVIDFGSEPGENLYDLDKDTMKLYINGVEGTSLTLGETTPPPSDDFAFTVAGTAGPVAGTEVKNAEEKVIGVVWDGCKLVNVNTANNDYIAKFTTTTTGYEGADRKTTLDLGDVETMGSVEFDAVMWFAGEAKSGVKMNVVEQAK